MLDGSALIATQHYFFLIANMPDTAQQQACLLGDQLSFPARVQRAHHFIQLSVVLRRMLIG